MPAEALIAVYEGEVFFDSILELGNFLEISVCKRKTDFVKNNFSNKYRMLDEHRFYIITTWHT
jgi:hypothetical protein